MNQLRSWPPVPAGEEEGDEPYVEQVNPPDPFRIGQCYANKPAAKLACAACGNDKFSVGSSDYFTAIRCDDCGWEVCIHNG